MTIRKLVPFMTVLICALAAPAAFAQEDASQKSTEQSGEAAADDAETAPEEDAADENDAETLDETADAEEDDAETEAAEDDDEETEDDDEATDEGMTLTPPQSMELDMSALGAMDPEKELAEGGDVDQTESEVDRRDWTERAMDLLELHGYFRLRPELYHKFFIRNDDAVYNQPMAQRDGESSTKNNTLAGANLRFRLEPTLNISEDIRIKSQMDFLDNVMLGSTPRYMQGYMASGSSSTIDVGRVQGWDMGAPDAGQMLVVRRVWGEVKTPFGHLRFGRMGDDWGLGMLHNSGNGLTDDFGDSVDRILFAAKVNDWLIMPAFDFPSEGMSASDASGRPFDVSQLDDSYRLVGIFGYIHDKEDQAAILKRGDWLINAGLYFSYQWQVMSFENKSQYSGTMDPDNDPGARNPTSDADPYKFYKREVWQITPDLWFQLLYGPLHLELEAALIFGEVGNPDRGNTDELDPLTLLQWGMVLQIDYGLLNDALRIGAEFGYAQGDEDLGFTESGMRAPSSFDQKSTGDDTFSAFSFNPAYNVDLILHRHILGSVSQSMYLKAFVQYDFLKNPMGRNLSLRADVIYSRMIYEKSSISTTSPNLGVELDAQILYKSQDGFYGGLSYGVLFPLGAFKGDPDQGDTVYNNDSDLDIPQTVQAVLGIQF